MIKNMQEIIDGDYNIEVGQTVRVRDVKGLTGVPPHDGETYLVKITSEHPYIYAGVVLPHMHRSGYRIMPSFNISISKIDLRIGDVQVMR